MARKKVAEMTEQERAAMLAKGAKRKEKRGNVNAMIDTLINDIISDSYDPDAIRELALKIKEGRRKTAGGRGAGGPKKLDIILSMFADSDTVSEEEIWGRYKLGRAEMRRIMVNAIKKAATPDDRKYIDFNADKGEYTLVAVGAEYPAGWNGYRITKGEEVQV